MRYDPLYFNIFMICIYVLNTMNWAWQRNWPQTLYWFAAALITVAVTWGLNK